MLSVVRHQDTSHLCFQCEGEDISIGHFPSINFLIPDSLLQCLRSFNLHFYQEPVSLSAMHFQSLLILSLAALSLAKKGDKCGWGDKQGTCQEASSCTSHGTLFLESCETPTIASPFSCTREDKNITLPQAAFDDHFQVSLLIMDARTIRKTSSAVSTSIAPRFRKRH